MNDEFKKLDNLMYRNVPKVSQRVLRRKVTFKKQNWWAVVAAFGLAMFIGFSIFNSRQYNLDSAVALSEVLDWDVTSDETPADVEFTLAMLE